MNITIFIGVASFSLLTEMYGRKKLINFLSIFITLFWLLVYFAQDKTTILISRLIGGIPYGGILLVLYVSVSEYVSPNMRPLAMNLVAGVGQSMGTAIGHVLCTVLHWRTVAILGVIPAIVSAILPFFWVESPFWLATKQRFEECDKSFRALHESTDASEKELNALIESQTYNLSNNVKYNRSVIVKYIRLWKEKRFWKMTAMVLLVGLYRVVGGRILINTLALSMLQDITGNKNILNYTLVVNGFVILGSSMSCALVSKFKIRPLLLTSGFISNCIQIILAICIYAFPEKDELTSWIKIILLALYFITVIAGPYAVLEPVMLELMPLDGKAIQIVMTSGIFGILHFYHVQISMKFLATIGYHGIFFIDGIGTFFCLICCYLYLPETKNRTLQEIEFYFVNNTFATDAHKKVAEEEKLFEENVENIIINIGLNKIKEK